MGETVEVSLVFPAYNEVAGLERAIATADAEVIQDSCLIRDHSS